MNSYLIYLFQVSACQVALYLLYHFTLKNHSFFQANRAFLLFSTFISFIIPLLSFEVWNADTANTLSGLSLSFLNNSPAANPQSVAPSEIGNTLDWPALLIYAFIIIYLLGVLVQLIKIILSIKRVYAFINKNETVQNNNIIRIQSGPPFFSFWKYIFVNEKKLELSDDALRQVIRHEQVHVQQQHTIDILFMELAIAICWFNPYIYKARNELIQIHEYIADQKVVLGDASIDDYSQLILQLSVAKNNIPLTHQFSKINIKNRIKMLNQSNTSKMKTLKFLLAIPVLSLLLAIFSFTEKPSEISSKSQTLHQEGLVIGQIQWEGNTKYSDEKLTEILGILPGDVYQKEKVENLLSYQPDKITVSDLYMDTGHLFFSILAEEEIKEEKVNLLFKVYEGATATVDKIIIKGNDKISTDKILDMMEVKKGDLFNRTKLIASQKNIAKSGYFNPENVGINPIPHDEGLMDIEFILEEL